MKNRSYQDKILRQELSERRARRKLCDQFGLCQSESSIQKTLSNHTAHAPTLSASNDDFFESFSEQDDERVTKETEFDYGDGINQNQSSMEDFKSLEERNDIISNSTSITSVVENITNANIIGSKCNSDCTAYSDNPICEEENCVTSFNESNEYGYLSNSPITPVIIAQDINKQLDSVREDIQRLEDITKLEIDSSRVAIQCLDDITKTTKQDKSLDNVSHCSQDACHHPKFNRNKDKEKESYKDIIPIWSKLVNYAYQIVQLNHGTYAYSKLVLGSCYMPKIRLKRFNFTANYQLKFPVCDQYLSKLTFPFPTLPPFLKCLSFELPNLSQKVSTPFQRRRSREKITQTCIYAIPFF